MSRTTKPTDAILQIPPEDRERLVTGEHTEPHGVLGAHPAPDGRGTVVRAFHPDAASAECQVEGAEKPTAMKSLGDGLFAARLRRTLPFRYLIRFRFPSGDTWEHPDPYQFLPTLGEMDLHLFNEGTHRQLWTRLGAHVRQVNDVRGVSFAVWAPTARRVSVVGEFCRWDGRLFPMRQLGSSGVFELFVPGVEPGALYKFEIKTRSGDIRIKTDPMAASMELPPGTASRVYESRYAWSDDDWTAARAARDPLREPMSVYEVHLGSWARMPEEGHRPLSYREIAPKLIDHARRHGFTHLEFLPLAEHPFTGSWGYQVSGYYAPTARYGTPDDLRYLIDQCHDAGIGVILDWVPAHFPKDDFALRRFDGSALYEHEDPRRGEHPDWGTLIFNFGRPEVRCFLLSNALYWLDEFHVDGLRVDAVASMLYLDYSRSEGEWIPNPYGGRENIEAIDFLRQVNTVIRDTRPGCIMVAEESTAWPGVTRPPEAGGLGFTLKWNMGWMHDTLRYFAQDPVHRRYHHDVLTFAMLYEHSERFVMPLSHDEVVHGKGSLYGKMPGDPWQKLANLRLLYTYMYTRPGKQLLFMGGELAQEREWDHDRSLDWHLTDDPNRRGLVRFFEDLGALYRETPPLWRGDPDPEGFAWIDCNDRENSVFTFERRAEGAHVVVVLNCTPVPRDGYRIGVPARTTYRQVFSSDDRRYGGSDLETPAVVEAEPTPFHGFAQSVVLRLPPLGALVLTPG
jgi:1,4-alpha-glucan branching enzyme